MSGPARATVAPPARAVLPGGLWRDGDAPLRELPLRALGDDDQVFALDSRDAGLLPSARATALLQRCLGDEAAAGLAPALTVGDREALLLQLRRLSFGDTIDCVLHCPAPGCGAPMELALHVGDLLLPAYTDVAREHALDVAHAGALHELSFRLPTAADLDAAAALVGDGTENAERAELELLRRSLVHATRDGIPIAAEELPPAVRDAVAAAIAAHDPQAEIELALSCPACGHAFALVFDTANYLLQELDGRAVQTLREVHVLAQHYGWSERDILQMPARRRAAYIGLIAEGQAIARTR